MENNQQNTLANLQMANKYHKKEGIVFITTPSSSIKSNLQIVQKYFYSSLTTSDSSSFFDGKIQPYIKIAARITRIGFPPT